MMGKEDNLDDYYNNEEQSGIVFTCEDKKVLKIIIDDKGNPFLKAYLDEYLFGKLDIIVQIENTFKNDILEPDDIKDVREQIASLDNDSLKGIYYLELQEKVPYHNQRNNSHTDIAGRMCNLTSEAMCLEYLGISCPFDKQFEDYLEDLRVKNNYGDRTIQDSRKDIASLFNVCLKKMNADAKDKTTFTNKLLPELQKGNSIMIGGLMSGFKHLVRLQSVTDEGIYIDDPWGEINFNTDCTAKDYTANNKESENEKCSGNNSFLSWCQVELIGFWVVDVYYICNEENSEVEQ